MIRYVEEFGKYVAITGFKNAKIIDVEKFLEKVRKEKTSKVEIQFFDAKLVATWQHLYFAALNALTAFKNKYNISKSFEVETMLYASAQRQIRKAMEVMGIEPRSTDIAVLVVGDKTEEIEKTLLTISKHVDVQSDDKVLELSKEKVATIRETLRISDVELETVKRKHNAKNALVDLVIERMALLPTYR